MKPTTLVKFPALVLLALVLVVALLTLPESTLAAAKDTTTLNVDYVIALLDSGVERAKIVERIESKGLTFRLAPGDVARLRAAGADDKVIDAVVDHAAVLESQGQAPAPQGTEGWGRPNRLGNSGGGGSGQEQTAPPADEEQQYTQQYGEDGQGIEEAPYGGSYGYYYPGYYGGYYDYWYGYPYPYYYGYPYGAYYYYSSPYYHSYYPRYYRYGFSGRGGGGVRTVPRGTRPMGAPRSGGGSHSAPRSAPRGSHH